MSLQIDADQAVLPALALSCSAQGVSVALATTREQARPVIECWHEPDSAGRSDALLSAVDGLLRANDVSVAALRLLCVEVGPGPFTAIRMTCSVAQGISLAAGVPCVEVWSTEALALQAVAGRPAGRHRVWVAVDARMGEVYAATVDIVTGPGGGLRQVVESGPCTVSPPDKSWALSGPGLAPDGSSDLLIAGNAGTLLSGFAEQIERQAIEAGWRVVHASSATVLRADSVLGVGLWRAGSACLEPVAPRYVRNKVALDVAEQAAARGRAAEARRA